MSIELKSTGTLIDELITTELKIEFFQQESAKLSNLQSRHEQLDLAITRRLSRQNQENKDIFYILSILIMKLRATNRKCWVAQDTVMSNSYLRNMSEDCSHYCKYQECALAAIEAQRQNSQRNIYIREIDKLLGEDQYTQLEKSYA